MGKFKSKASKVKATGEARRGNFTPKPGSVPARAYNYWLHRSPSKKADRIVSGRTRENFCHYWRVVAFWAPLWKMFDIAEAVFTSPITGVVALLGFIALFVYGFTAVSGFGIIVLQVIAGVIGIAIAAAIFVGIIYVLSEIVPQKFPRFADAVERFFKSGKTWLTFFGLVLALIIFATSNGHGFVGYAIWAAVILAISAVGYLIYRSVEADERRQEQRQAEWDALDWETQYEILEWLRAVREMKRVPSKAELKVRGFFRGAKEIAIFAVQVVRVNKWKICPLVEIDPK